LCYNIKDLNSHVKSMDNKIKKTSTANVNWVDIINPDNTEIDFLRNQYNFHPLNLEDASIKSKAQRPKFDMYNEYLFLILHFPVYNKVEGRIHSTEIDFFIGKNYLITLHNDSLAPLHDFYKMCSEFEHYRNQFMDKNPSVLLYELLDRLLNYCFPLMDHISEDIELIEDRIFEGKERQMVREILQTKRNIANFRKIMQSHNKIIRKLIDMDSSFFPKINMATYYNDLVEETYDIWKILETQKETIDALHQTNESSLSFQLNDIMKTLTIFSVVVFPLTLLAGIFGMNTVNTPFIGDRYDFWEIISVMGGLTLVMFIYFKSKKWL